jgi:hypothetical protein
MRDWREARNDETGLASVLVDVLGDVQAMRMGDVSIESQLDATFGCEIFSYLGEYRDKLIIERARRARLA